MGIIQYINDQTNRLNCIKNEYNKYNETEEILNHLLIYAS